MLAVITLILGLAFIGLRLLAVPFVISLILISIVTVLFIGIAAYAISFLRLHFIVGKAQSVGQYSAV